jgi:glycosyltransferase involved in cell wall biosynthesis
MSASGEKAAPWRLGLVGWFYPAIGHSGSFSTGLAMSLAESPRVRSVDVFGQEGCEIPSGLEGAVRSLTGTFEADSPAALVRLFLSLLRRVGSLDAVVFNIYATAFGRSRITNGLGLMVPVAVRVLGRVPVVVYMHNLVETQDLPGLGYPARSLTATAGAVVERLMCTFVRVVVPLKSQTRTRNDGRALRVEAAFLPYMDFLFAARQRFRRNRMIGTVTPPTPARGYDVVLFGNWGPQKDLIGATNALRDALRELPDLSVAIVGDVNPHFPQYRRVFETVRSSLPTDHFRFLGALGDVQALELLEGSSVLVLPYNATGGMSGAMNLGSLTGASIVAYDLPQLRETAELLRTPVRFVTRNDIPELTRAVVAAVRDRRAAPVPPPPSRSEEILRTISLDAVEPILRVLDRG